MVIDLLLKAGEHVIKLLEKRQERTRALFLDHIDPIYRDLRHITDDYRSIPGVSTWASIRLP